MGVRLWTWGEYLRMTRYWPIEQACGTNRLAAGAKITATSHPYDNPNRANREYPKTS
jgi:hypothetical protein